MIDVPLLRKELEFITNNPKMHDQTVWLKKTDCGTAGCLAGNTILNHNPEKVLWHSDMELPYLKSIEGWAGTAADMLGLNWEQAQAIFSSYNTLWDMWALAELFSDGDIEIPPGLEPQRSDNHRAYVQDWHPAYYSAVEKRYKELS